MDNTTAQAPRRGTQALANDLALLLVRFLAPLVRKLDQYLDKRLVPL